jgi:hypothetical protein
MKKERKKFFASWETMRDLIRNLKMSNQKLCAPTRLQVVVALGLPGFKQIEN